MTSRALWPAVRRLASSLRRMACSLWQGYVDYGLAIYWVNPTPPYPSVRRRDTRPGNPPAAEDRPGFVPARLCGPPPGHPEQMVSGAPLTPVEARLWRELQEEL